MYGKTTHYPGQTPVWILDDSVWFHYAEPLMKLAHGYAQSLLTTLLQTIKPEDPTRTARRSSFRTGSAATTASGRKSTRRTTMSR